MIILDHGQGYLTLYGYNQSLYKKVVMQWRLGILLHLLDKVVAEIRQGYILEYAIKVCRLIRLNGAGNKLGPSN